MKEQKPLLPVTQVFALRGAITVGADTKEEVVSAVSELMDELCARNSVFSDGYEIVSIHASSTADIKSFYPAAAIRKFGIDDVPLFSAAEPDIAGGLPLCIRIIMTVSSVKHSRTTPAHVYLRGAKVLRPDLVKDDKAF